MADIVTNPEDMYDQVFSLFATESTVSVANDARDFVIV